jgi:DNA (cytosine-5)-methyltransferase 1
VDLRFGSVCSGIEAASIAWDPLGWKPQWFSEIEPFPSAVLAHRWPRVPNYGDFTKIGTDAPGIDLLVGGTPCQSFSIAGLRGGLDDDRGNLALEFLRLAQRLRRPRWIVWENVPGVLSSSDGRDFGTLLGALAECGYGWSYRVLDAQFLGVPLQRRRVLVVGHLGDWRPAAAVLSEPSVLRGDLGPRGDSREKAAALAAGSLGEHRPEPLFYNAEGGAGLPYLTRSNLAKTVNNQTPLIVLPDGRLRRFTPREVERLLGFPDDHTLVPFNGKPASDVPRYAALGNTMAVPMMRWIGWRIDCFERRRMAGVLADPNRAATA